MQNVITGILEKSDKKKVQSLCKKILKKCSFNSQSDLYNIVDLAYWLYIYGETDDSIQVCDLLKDLEFTGNYNLWSAVEDTLCLKARIMRERGDDEACKNLIDRVNEHRNPELYVNLVDWYRETLNINIKSDDEYHPGKIHPGWRFVKLRSAVRYREAGKFPIPDEEFEKDISELLDYLKQAK